MPLPQKKLIPSILLMLALAALAVPPLWWSAGVPPVIAPGATENNQGPANIGQAKHMAESALDALRPILPAVAAEIEADLTEGTNPILDFTVPNPKTPDWIEKQKTSLLIGQLKAISAPFYTRLHAAAPTWLAAERTTNGTLHPNSIFPWTAETTDDANKAIANIGQLKAVFSLRFETLPPTDSDGDGLPDAWELQHFTNLDQTASGDPDNDGLTNAQELVMGTDPTTIGADANGNGLPDDWELANAGKFAAFPPLLAAKIPRTQSEAKPLVLSNNTDSAVNYSVTVSGATLPGYSYADSLSGGIAYSWEDISATGTRLAAISAADDAFEPAPFTGFSFPFYGQNFSQVLVSSNGLLSFGAGSASYGNTSLPGASAPPNIIAPFWDDLDTRTSGDIYYKQESGRFIVQFQNVSRYGQSLTLTFQAVFFADGRIQFRYHTLNGSVNSCTVGIQNVARDKGLEIAYNTAYLQNGMLVEIRPDFEFLTFSQPAGSVPAHSVLTLNGLFRSFTLPPGVYPAEVEISHDSPGTAPIPVGGRLEVESRPGTIALTYPTEGHSVFEGNYIYFAASASDPDGIAKVEFYYGANKFAEDTTSPYSLYESNLPPGTHLITAYLVDSSGSITASAPLTVEVIADSDRDSIPDAWETANGLNPNDSTDAALDTDQDGYNSFEEYTFGKNPNLAEDTDGDDTPDGWEYHNGTQILVADASEDPDSDGLTNLAEYLNSTNPNNWDTDDDFLPDGWEIQHGLVAVSSIQINGTWVYGYDGANGSTGDPDSDGIENQYEYLLGFEPKNANTGGTADNTKDRDGDGMKDFQEAATGNFQWDDQQQRYFFTKALDWEVADADADLDNDGLTNVQELLHGTDLLDPDTDNDFMPDGWEVQHNGKTVILTAGATGAASAPPSGAGTNFTPATVSLNPLDASDAALDPDQDGLTNLQEYLNGTLPYLYDTDGDGASDGDESNSGSNPNDPSDGGVPGGPGSGTAVVEMPFAIGGDYAWWEMIITGQGPTDTRIQKIHSSKNAESGLGDYLGATQMVKLHAGNAYRITMKRMGGVEDWYCWSANVGQQGETNALLPNVRTFPNYPASKNDRLADQAIAYPANAENSEGRKVTWLVDNKDGLFTQHIDDYNNDVVQGLEAFLLPIDIEEVISDQIAGNEANKLPTAYFGGNPAKPGNGHPNNPMLMATRSGSDARLMIKMNVPAAQAASIRVGVRQTGQTTILNSVASVPPPGKTPLSFTALSGSTPTKLYEVVAGYDANSNAVLENSEVAVVFEKTPRKDREGNTATTNLHLLDKFIVVTLDDFTAARAVTEGYGNGTAINTLYPTAAKMIAGFARGATTITGSSVPELGVLLDASTIPSLEGLSHPLGGKWNAAKQTTTHRLVLPTGSDLSEDVVGSTGLRDMYARALWNYRGTIAAGATTSWGVVKITFIDKDIDFSASDTNDQVHAVLGKCNFVGSLEVSCKLKAGGGFDVGALNCYGAMVDLYDFGYGAPKVTFLGIDIADPKEGARTQAGFATLTFSPWPDAGRVFFTKVELGTGWFDYTGSYPP